MTKLFSSMDVDSLNDIYMFAEEFNFLLNMLRPKKVGEKKLMTKEELKRTISYLTRMSLNSSRILDTIDTLVKLELLSKTERGEYYLNPNADKYWRELLVNKTRILNETEISPKPIINATRVSQLISQHKNKLENKEVSPFDVNEVTNIFVSLVKRLVRDFCSTMKMDCDIVIQELDKSEKNDDARVRELLIKRIRNKIQIYGEITLLREKLVDKCPYKLMLEDSSLENVNKPCGYLCRKALYSIVEQYNSEINAGAIIEKDNGLIKTYPTENIIEITQFRSDCLKDLHSENGSSNQSNEYEMVIKLGLVLILKEV